MRKNLLKSQRDLRFFLNVLWLIAALFLTPALADEPLSVDELLEKVTDSLNTNPGKAEFFLEKLKKLKPTFNKKQEGLYYIRLSISLGFRGEHKEKIELIRSIINTLNDDEVKAFLLYQLSLSLTTLGQYEDALSVMNEEIVLLPKLTTLSGKASALQVAIDFLNSIGSYDESLAYANRMLALEEGKENSPAKCYGYANLIEINFFKKNSVYVQNNLKNTIQACNGINRDIVSQIVKSLGAVDAINSGDLDHGIALGLPLLKDLTNLVRSSEYVIRMEEALARAYLAKKDLVMAEQFGLRAYQKAKRENIVHLLESATETMAVIKQAQNQLAASIEYYKINSELKKKLLDDQLHRNLAYQRVKFDTQDKANQLTLLEQKNKILLVEKQLELRKNENLVLLISLGTVLLAVISGWLITTWRQKNMFRKTSQTDGLTDISNRTHFIDSAQKYSLTADKT